MLLLLVEAVEAVGSATASALKPSCSSLLFFFKAVGATLASAISLLLLLFVECLGEISPPAATSASSSLPPSCSSVILLFGAAGGETAKAASFFSEPVPPGSATSLAPPCSLVNDKPTHMGVINTHHDRSPTTTCI